LYVVDALAYEITPFTVIIALYKSGVAASYLDLSKLAEIAAAVAAA